ncbi:NAD(P)-binding protein [Lentinus tigrinus ALCF2SS1-7]|uniref:NAD(P)-binding protein n=1 Tax=Lentinus tigrinus ALCF2SS1-6 TaxID=1328759 RepID=A0A5C2SRW6_9APHY|nr:NAD(P)-binding protein [Lentinus tigrinus ALCF2SS1-6]RPD76318.1 NAD(P)-binding protein [Lentinus tigrinus ALCF2SS1-7]
MSAPRVWLVTGASSGFGRAMVRCALSHGDKVVATMRKPSMLAEFASQYPSSQLIVVKLDVSNHEEIKEVFRKAKAAFGRVDIVFNNAGYGVLGEAETIPDDPARQMFEVNFWGAVHVSQEAVRFFREENRPQGGHLVQNSATVGIVSHPVMAFYGASKHALEGFSETLQKELNPAWNIKVSLVEPGAFLTEIVTANQFVPQHPAYADPTSITSTIRKLFSEDIRKLPFSDPDKGVQKIFELTKLASPPLHLPLGKDSVGNIRAHIADLTKVVDEYASWSDNIALEGNGDKI